MKYRLYQRPIVVALVAAGFAALVYADTPQPGPNTGSDPNQKPVLYTDQILTPVGERIQVTKVDLTALIVPGATIQAETHNKEVMDATAQLIDRSLQSDGVASACKGLCSQDQARFEEAAPAGAANQPRPAEAKPARNDDLETQLALLRSTFKSKYNQDLAFSGSDLVANTTYLEAKVDDSAAFQQHWPVRAIFSQAGKPTGVVVNDKNRKEPKALLGEEGPAIDANAARAAADASVRSPTASDAKVKHNIPAADDTVELLELDGNNVSAAVVVSFIMQDGKPRIVLPQATNRSQIEMNLANQVRAINESKIWTGDASSAKRIIAKNVLMAYYDDGSYIRTRSTDADSSNGNK